MPLCSYISDLFTDLKYDPVVVEIRYRNSIPPYSKSCPFPPFSQESIPILPVYYFRPLIGASEDLTDQNLIYRFKIHIGPRDVFIRFIWKRNT
jgi:hypothetical protein